MKVTHFKIPVSLKREADGTISMIIDEAKKELEREENLGASTQDIVTLSKKLSDENEMQKQILRSSLFASEDKLEGFLTLKFLSE